MHTPDILVTVILIAAFIIGYTRGLVRQAGSVCAVILGIIAARLFGPTATEWFMPSTAPEGSSMTDYGATAAGYIAVFAIVWIGVWLVSRLLHGALKAIRLGWANALAGAFFSALEWGLGISAALNLWHICSPSWEPTGPVTKTVMTFMPWLTGIVRQCQL